jgi:pimeloyl-ACP methyl ester carboxylesterase
MISPPASRARRPLTWLRILLPLALVGCNSSEPASNGHLSFVPPARGVAGSGLARAEFGGNCALRTIPDERLVRQAIDDGSCVKLYQPGFALVVEHFAGPSGTLPLLIVRPRENAPIRRIVVRMIGGPAGDIQPGLMTDRGRSLGLAAQRGTVTVFPGYAGTRHRLVEGADTIDLAAGELRAYVADLKRRHAEAEIAVVGESMGGYITARASPELPRVPLILFSPPLTTPRTLLSRVAALSPEGTRVDRTLVVVSRLHEGRVEPIEPRMTLQWRMLNDILSGHLDTDLADFLRQSRGRCVALIYGDADPIIGVPSIDAVRERVPGITIRAISHMKHAPDDGAEWALAEREIEREIDESPCGRADSPQEERAPL